VHRNALALAKLRQRKAAARPLHVRIADAITAFTGSMSFVYLHIVWFAVWISLNVEAFDLEPFDPYPFGLLTMIVSLEAIFLSTFVLVSQNRMSQEAEERAELDLHINVLAEHELTHLFLMIEAIAKKVGAPIRDPEIKDLERDLRIADLLHEISARPGDPSERPSEE
jgi:uncharacterized membrane protein